MPYCAYCGAAVPAISDAPCPQCGQAISGAATPSRRAVQSSRTGVIIGVSAAVLAVILLVLFYAVILPRFQAVTESVPQRLTVTIMQDMARLIETHRMTKGSYPATLDEISPRSQDAWGRALRYECLSRQSECDGYVLASPGRDGIYEKPNLGDYTVRETSDLDADLVFRNGSFVQYPEGTPR